MRHKNPDVQHILQHLGAGAAITENGLLLTGLTPGQQTIVAHQGRGYGRRPATQWHPDTFSRPHSSGVLKHQRTYPWLPQAASGIRWTYESAWFTDSNNFWWDVETGTWEVILLLPCTNGERYPVLLSVSPTEEYIDGWFVNTRESIEAKNLSCQARYYAGSEIGSISGFAYTNSFFLDSHPTFDVTLQLIRDPASYGIEMLGGDFYDWYDDVYQYWANRWWPRPEGEPLDEVWVDGCFPPGHQWPPVSEPTSEVCLHAPFTLLSPVESDPSQLRMTFAWGDEVTVTLTLTIENLPYQFTECDKGDPFDVKWLYFWFHVYYGESECSGNKGRLKKYANSPNISLSPYGTDEETLLMYIFNGYRGTQTQTISVEEVTA